MMMMMMMMMMVMLMMIACVLFCTAALVLHVNDDLCLLRGWMFSFPVRSSDHLVEFLCGAVRWI